MPKTLIIAFSEFSTLVRSKAFVIGVFMMPVLMGGAIAAQRMMRGRGDTAERRFAIIDRTGVLFDRLAADAEGWNQGTRGVDGVATGPRFVPIRIDSSGKPDAEMRLDLSERIRRKDLFAFIEIPAEILASGSTARLRYHSDNPTYASLPRWLETAVNRHVLESRFRTANVDAALVRQLTRRVNVEQLGLVERTSGGAVGEAAAVDPVRAFGVPAGLMFLLFIIVVSSAPQLLNAVIEEKMSRISEVLLGSVAPFELMMGKLLGSAAVSSLLAMIYVVGAMTVAQRYGYADAVQPRIAVAFVVALVLSVFLFGSLFVAIGSACTDLKDAQNMMTPAMFLMMMPMFTWTLVMRAPESTPAVVLSLFPLATPFLMLLRMSLAPGPPLWQVVLAVALTTGTAVLMVWAGGRIFRTGLLMQGKSASLREMLRWVRA